MSFWVYENWTAEHKAVIHCSSCGYCNNGAGCHDNPLGDRNGRWLGPYSTQEEAATAAMATGRPIHEHSCLKNRVAREALHPVAKGRIAEALVTANLLENGLEVYEPLVDVRGIDFVARSPGGSFLEIQVKGVATKRDPAWFQIQAKDVDELVERPQFVICVTAGREYWIIPTVVFCCARYATISTPRGKPTTVDLNLLAKRRGADRPNRERLARFRDAWQLLHDASQNPVMLKQLLGELQ